MPKRKPDVKLPRDRRPSNGSVRSMLDDVQALDLRRQAQISNQRDVINRLLKAADIEDVNVLAEVESVCMNMSHYRAAYETLVEAVEKVQAEDGLPDGLLAALETSRKLMNTHD